MNRLDVYLGKWMGVPVTLNWSWVLLFVFFCFVDLRFAAFYAVIFFLVLLHELGHCFAAQRLDVPVHDIILCPIGGVAGIEMPDDPKKELIVTCAGPLVNVVLAFPLYVLAFLANTYLHETQFDNYGSRLFAVNLMLFFFNIIPLFPMDGGRVFRSLLSLLLNDHLKATKIAVYVSHFLSFAFIMGGIYFGLYTVPIIGIMMFFAANSELDRTIQNYTSKLPDLPLQR